VTVGVIRRGQSIDLTGLNMRHYTFRDLEESIPKDSIIVGNTELVKLANARSLSTGQEDSIIWLNKENSENLEIIQNCKANVIIADRSVFKEIKKDGCLLIWVAEPRLVFLRVINRLFNAKPSNSVDPSARIHPDAIIANDVFVGAGVYIGKSVVGNGTVIYANCVIYDNVKIGKNVTIHAGTIVGADGFGYQRNEFNELEKFPHIGGVVIEDDVEIGSNTCIDRGTLEDTLVKRGAKIDNLVHIAHNVIIGKHAAVIAHAMIGGSTSLGDYSWVAPNAALRDGLSIGINSVIGLGAVVTKNIPDKETWTGNPARELKEFLALQNKLKRI
jgi:UDP-3-O-[3-hydroxymyristoyl] glucosamine N-acyltransferase